jgi:hypothetical protein
VFDQDPQSPTPRTVEHVHQRVLINDIADEFGLPIQGIEDEVDSVNELKGTGRNEVRR